MCQSVRGLSGVRWLESSERTRLAAQPSRVSCSVVSGSSTPWTVAHQASLSMEFSRQESWSGLPFPSPRDLPDPGIELRSLALQADSLLSEPPGKSYLILVVYKSVHDQ